MTTCQKGSHLYLVLVDRVDDAVVVQDDHVRVADVERDVPDGAGSTQPLDGQLLRELLGEGRVLATDDVVLDDLVIGVRHHQEMRRRMEGQRRRVTLVARQSGVHFVGFQVQDDDVARVIGHGGQSTVGRAVHQMDAVVHRELAALAAERVNHFHRSRAANVNQLERQFRRGQQEPGREVGLCRVMDEHHPVAGADVFRRYQLFELQCSSRLGEKNK